MALEQEVTSDIAPVLQGHGDNWRPSWPPLSSNPANGHIRLFSGFTDGSDKPRNDQEAVQGHPCHRY